MRRQKAGPGAVRSHGMTRYDAAAIAVLALAALAIACTWTTFAATVDEPMHVSAGLELYTQRTYSYQPENPPLVRLAIAFAPWLANMSFDPRRPREEQLLRVFHSNDEYEMNLVRARAGNLLFFLIAAIATWRWGRRELGDAGGFFAALLFATQPVVAGHAGLATHDIGAAAGVALSLLAFTRWLGERTVMRAIAFGAAFGFAVLCKFSAIGYVPAACLVLLTARRGAVKTLLAAIPATLFAIAAGYGFIGIPRFIDGIRGLIAVDQAGVLNFLLGEVSFEGWWWYFPVALALKTTLASLILALLTKKRAILLAALAVLGVAMLSNTNLGVRHILPLYAPLSVAAASACVARKRALVAALLVWHGAATVIAYPDHFPYFNEIAMGRPERYLLDSNLDWGQDALRLVRAAREKKIDRIGVKVFGWHDWEALGLPPHYQLEPRVPSQGWIAVSEQSMLIAGHPPWLDGRRYERVGTSIRLYYIP
jgi:Dolichyl-phosphate-mannose-protein mannosyltransferase